MPEENGLATMRFRIERLERDCEEVKMELDAIRKDLLSRLDDISTQLRTLQLHEARMEPIERVMWVVIGVAATTVVAGIIQRVLMGGGHV